MALFSLRDRLTEIGTLLEPSGIPDPDFALQSTINWMRGLALLSENINFSTANQFYQTVPIFNFDKQRENTIFESLLFGIHQLSGLKALKAIVNNSDAARIGVAAWYSGIFHASKAMITSYSGSFQETNISIIKAWDDQIAVNQLVMEPFKWRITSLVSDVIKKEITELRNGNDFRLMTKPQSKNEALGACLTYLAGTADWRKWCIEKEIKSGDELQSLNLTDFRKKEAKVIRDKYLARETICFLLQAYRYQGKANYREFYFLGYGGSTEKKLSGYVDDLVQVLQAYLCMSGAYCAARLGRDLWKSFIEDVEASRSFSTSVNGIWTL